MMSISGLVGSSRKIASWWSRDPTGIVKKNQQLQFLCVCCVLVRCVWVNQKKKKKFTRKTTETRAKNPTSRFAVTDLLQYDPLRTAAGAETE